MYLKKFRKPRRSKGCFPVGARQKPSKAVVQDLLLMLELLVGNGLENKTQASQKEDLSLQKCKAS